MSKKIVDIPNGIVQEMSKKYTGGNIEVPLASGVDLDQLLKNDDDPMFVTIDALSDTISGNKRRWTSDELHRIAEQVTSKKPDGYQGHLKAEDRSSKAPDAVTMWLGAKVANHDGKQHLFIKGYVLPRAAQFKDYLRRASAAGKNVAVSVYGQAMEVWNDSLNAFEVKNFVLESIDWARPGSEGVPNSGYMKITAEMNDNDGGDPVDKVEVLKATTVSEMQEHNPSVVQELQEAGKSAIVSEMATALGLEDSSEIVKVVSEMKAANDTLNTQVAENEVDKILGNKVPNVSARKMLRKQVIGEMAGTTDLKVVQETVEAVLKSEEGQAVVAAFKTPVVTPGGGDHREVKSGSRFIKK